MHWSRGDFVCIQKCAGGGEGVKQNSKSTGVRATSELKSTRQGGKKKVFQSAPPTFLIAAALREIKTFIKLYLLSM